MTNDFIVEELKTKRDKMITERNALYYHQTKNIEAIENAIEQLSGKKASEVIVEEKYDDTSPDYIKGTEDGI